MSNNGTGLSTSTGNLPANIANLAGGLAASVAAAPTSGGSFMKFTKFGEWSYGAEDTPVEEGSQWAVNPNGFLHGWIAWGDKAHGNEGTKVDEVMCSAAEPHPACPDPVAGNWSQQRAIQLACISGEDEGLNVMFNTNSRGGLNCYNEIVKEVVRKIQAGETKIVPIVELEADHYMHNTYGKIFVPVMVVVAWVGLDDIPDGPVEDDDEEEEEAPAPAPKKRTRQAKSKAKSEPEPEQEEEAPRRRRRRRA